MIVEEERKRRAGEDKGEMVKGENAEMKERKESKKDELN